MNKKIKFALIGCSRISKKHLEALLILKNSCTLVDVCDIDIELAKKTAIKFNANAYDDFDLLVKESNADCLIIATPSGLHASQSIQGMQNGYHVVTEKPMAVSMKDAMKMLKVSKKEKKNLFVVKQVRFLDQIQKIYKCIKENRFGKIYMFNANLFITRPENYFEESDWRGSKIMDGGALLNQSSHFIDLALWLLGPVDNVSAFNDTLARRIETEDSSIINLRFKSGALGSINTTILTYPKNIGNSMTIIGEKGTIQLGGAYINRIDKWEFLDKNSYDYIEGETLDLDISHEPFYKNVIDSLHLKSKPLIDGNEGIKSIELIDRCYKSSKNKEIF